MSGSEKKKREPKYKTQVKVLENSALVGKCSCGWVGNALAQSSGLALALAAVQSEIQGHKHVPKPKKVKKVIDSCCGNMHSAKCYDCPLLNPPVKKEKKK